jgi:hypothetical protein
MIGSIVITTQDVEGIIIDKIERATNGASSTVYMFMEPDGSVTPIDYDEVSEIVSFGNTPGIYLKREKEFKL